MDDQKRLPARTSVPGVLAKRFPPEFPLRMLREKGDRESFRATRVEIEGDYICAVVPGMKENYYATKAVISWDTPMDISGLMLQDNVGLERRVELGRLEFHASRAPQLVDPDIELYTENGVIEIHQAFGVPTLYMRNCRMVYKNG